MYIRLPTTQCTTPERAHSPGLKAALELVEGGEEGGSRDTYCRSGTCCANMLASANGGRDHCLP